MNLKRILTIFNKDAKSSLTDGRVLVAIAIPIAFAVLYTFIFNQQEQTPSVTVAHTETTSALPEALGAATGDTAELTFQGAPAEEVRQMVTDEDADIGLVAPEGFDAAVQGGESPQLTVLLPESPSLESGAVASSVEPALRALAGQGAPASIQTEAVSGGGSGNILEQIGSDGYWVLVGVSFLLVMVCLYALPVILTDESEKKTLDALVMISSYREVIVAKALVGLLYIVLPVGLTLAFTRVMPENIILFGGSILLLGIVLIGFGLLMGGIFREASQLNTWSTLLAFPVLITASAVFFPLPAVAERVLDFLPTSQGMRLAANGMSGEAIFSEPAISFMVVAVWGVVAYLILLWTLRQRQA